MSSDQVTSQQTDSSLFAESEAGGLGFSGLLLVILSAVLVFGGFWLMGSAFGETEYAIELFMGGLIADFIGFAIAFTTFKK